MARNDNRSSARQHLSPGQQARSRCRRTECRFRRAPGHGIRCFARILAGSISEIEPAIPRLARAKHLQDSSTNPQFLPAHPSLIPPSATEFRNAVVIATGRVRNFAQEKRPQMSQDILEARSSPRPLPIESLRGPLAKRHTNRSSQTHAQVSPVRPLPRRHRTARNRLSNRVPALILLYDCHSHAPHLRLRETQRPQKRNLERRDA